MLDGYVDRDEIPAALRKIPAFVDLLGKAFELCWWDGFHRGAFATAIGFIVLIGAVLILRARAT